MNNKKPPVRLYKEENIMANNWTFIAIGFVLAIFFILFVAYTLFLLRSIIFKKKKSDS
jgi:flagellar biogenesis protein FliO